MHCPSERGFMLCATCPRAPLMRLNLSISLLCRSDGVPPRTFHRIVPHWFDVTSASTVTLGPDFGRIRSNDCSRPVRLRLPEPVVERGAARAICASSGGSPVRSHRFPELSLTGYDRSLQDNVGEAPLRVGPAARCRRGCENWQEASGFLYWGHQRSERRRMEGRRHQHPPTFEPSPFSSLWNAPQLPTPVLQGLYLRASTPVDHADDAGTAQGKSGRPDPVFWLERVRRSSCGRFLPRLRGGENEASSPRGPGPSSAGCCAPPQCGKRDSAGKETALRFRGKLASRTAYWRLAGVDSAASTGSAPGRPSQC